jgi:polar amino acid transport system substrate-binding protein
MFKLLTMVVALFSFVLPQGKASAAQLLVGVLINPPYISEAVSGEIEGLYPDLVREALAQMGHVPIFIPVPFARGMLMLETGELDSFMPVFKTPERENFAFYPDEPLSIKVVALFAKSDLVDKFNGDYSSLYGLRIARLIHSTQSQNLDQAIRDGILIEVTGNSIAQLFLMLEHDRVDLIVSDTLGAEAQMFLKNSPYNIVALKPPVSKRPVFMVFSRNGKWPNLAAEFSTVLRSIRGAGN